MDTKKFFNQVAASANPMLFTEEEHLRIDTLKTRLGDLAGLRILEPGCGAGPLTEYLADWVGAAGHVLAFDSSPEMVDVCRRRLEKRDTPARVDIECADLETMPLATGGWDRVILFRVFPHLQDKASIVERIRPALAPGGELVVANLEGSVGLNRFHAALDAPVRHHHMPCIIGMTRLLEKHGYAIVTAEDSENEFLFRARPIPKKPADEREE